MEEEQIIKLIEKYVTGTASSVEIRLLNAWYDDFNKNPSLINTLSSTELEQASSKMFLKISEALDTFPEHNSGILNVENLKKLNNCK